MLADWGSVWAFILIVLLVGACKCQDSKSLGLACLCDTSTLCDAECCCDSACPASTRALLSKYNRCDDDGFGIPMCDALMTGDVNADDLYSGLKTIYMIVRRLFCLYRVNVIDPIGFYDRRPSDDGVQAALEQGLAKTV